MSQMEETLRQMTDEELVGWYKTGLRIVLGGDTLPIPTSVTYACVGSELRSRGYELDEVKEDVKSGEV